MRTLAWMIAVLVTTVAGTDLFSADGPATPSNAPTAAPTTGTAAQGQSRDGSATLGATNVAAPRIHFDAPVYDFGQVRAGELIKYTFMVSNAGSSKLVISDVHGTCGCTTAGAWTKEIEPGQTGLVPIQIDSSHLRGAIQKAAIVTSNDKAQPSVNLQLKGTIFQPIEISAQVAYIHLSADSDSNAPALIHISNKTGQPLTLSPPESANKSFTAELKTLAPGMEFELSVSTVPPLPSNNVSAQISMKTSSTNMPVLTVTAVAIPPRPPLVVQPRSVFLAPAFASKAVTHKVLIQSTVAKPLALSEASVNAKGVEAEIKELQAGRQYDVILTFPPGFQVPAGGGLELSLKSNYPQFPVIKIPIYQLPDATRVNAKKE